jgi:hypothetical protein
VAPGLAGPGIVVSTAVAHGDPASGILAAVEGHSDTLIAMSTHGRSGIAHWALGSVSDKVLHSTCNPLLIVRCHRDMVQREIELSTIIVPLDGSPPGAADFAFRD